MYVNKRCPFNCYVHINYFLLYRYWRYVSIVCLQCNFVVKCAYIVYKSFNCIGNCCLFRKSIILPLLACLSLNLFSWLFAWALKRNFLHLTFVGGFNFDISYKCVCVWDCELNTALQSFWTRKCISGVNVLAILFDSFIVLPFCGKYVCYSLRTPLTCWVIIFYF